MSFPQIHPRHSIVATARFKIATVINEAQKQHDLTYAELCNILAAELASLTSWAIREERYPPTPELQQPCRECGQLHTKEAGCLPE